MEAFPDLVALSDADLKALTEEKMAEERDVSRRRRQLHGRIDLLRSEHTRAPQGARGRASRSTPTIVSDELLAQLPGGARRPGRRRPAADRRGDRRHRAALRRRAARAHPRAAARASARSSFKRRILHGQIDLLRAEIIARLRERDGEASEHLAASDVEKLSEILSHRGPPLELPAELKRLD